MVNMAVKVFISGNSGNKEIETHQHRIFMILKSLNIEFTPVDITAPGNEEAKDYMRKTGKKKTGQRNVLPPQLYNDSDYCGDYEDFDVANEDDVLEEFLGLERKTPASAATEAAIKEMNEKRAAMQAEQAKQMEAAGTLPSGAPPAPTANPGAANGEEGAEAEEEEEYEEDEEGEYEEYEDEEEEE